MHNPTRIPEADLLPNGKFKPVQVGTLVYLRTDNRPATVVGNDPRIKGNTLVEYREAIHGTKLTAIRRPSLERDQFSLQPYEWLRPFGEPEPVQEVDLAELYRRTPA